MKGNKKLLICLCLIIAIAVVAFICVKIAKPSYKKQIKEFGEAMSNSEKMEKFVDEKVNLRAWYAISKLENDEDLDIKDEKAVKKAFEKAYKEAKKSDYESDENKESAKMLFGMLTLYTSMAGDDVKVEIKDIGKLKNSEQDGFKYMKEAEFTMKITANEKTEEIKWRALFYKDLLVFATPAEDANSDVDYETEYDDFDYDEDSETENEVEE